jgi:sugar/nucleoside kinase (ribokinase family)
MKHRIAVLGPIPRDRIITHHGEVIKKYGCIMHPVAALAALTGGQAEIIPVAHVRKVDEPFILDILKTFPGVNPSHVLSDYDQGAVVRLQFVDQNKRKERQLGFMPTILPEHVADLLDCDAFVFVPITDHEVSLDTLRFLKEHSKGQIIFDAHGPTTAMGRDGIRRLKFWADRDQWLPYIDVLKMNLEESGCCWFKKEFTQEELAIEINVGKTHLPELAAHCLERGVKAVCFTTDETGCLVYYLEDGQMREEFVPSLKVDHVVDTTGCGDSFAGGLAFGLLDSKNDFIRAAQFANAAGAQRTQGRTFDVFKSLEETNKMIEAGRIL